MAALRAEPCLRVWHPRALTACRTGSCLRNCLPGIELSAYCTIAPLHCRGSGVRPEGPQPQIGGGSQKWSTRLGGSRLCRCGPAAPARPAAGLIPQAASLCREEAKSHGAQQSQWYTGYRDAIVPDVQITAACMSGAQLAAAVVMKVGLLQGLLMLYTRLYMHAEHWHQLPPATKMHTEQRLCTTRGPSLRTGSRPGVAYLWHQVTMMMRPPGAATLASSPTNRGFSGMCSPLSRDQTRSKDLSSKGWCRASATCAGRSQVRSQGQGPGHAWVDSLVQKRACIHAGHLLPMGCSSGQASQFLHTLSLPPGRSQTLGRTAAASAPPRQA